MVSNNSINLPNHQNIFSHSINRIENKQTNILATILAEDLRQLYAAFNVLLCDKASSGPEYSEARCYRFPKLLRVDRTFAGRNLLKDSTLKLCCYRSNEACIHNLFHGPESGYEYILPKFNSGNTTRSNRCK
jgi:hypothetical protein